MQFFKYLSPKRVVFSSAVERNQVLKELVHCMHQEGILQNEEEFYEAILKREKVVSTEVGKGVAIPHARLASYDQFFIAIGILQKPVDWQSADQSPVRLVFMIGGPDDKQTEYLRLLSTLTHFIKDKELRKKLLTLQNPSDIIELFQTI